MSQTAASHWSIGEVLSLLQDEFPEITISKIRFLESQGLIDPERTPSGYRRFYESDFDRLRWILVQQRDHYLPLKVIRDRLDAGEWETDGAAVEVLDLTDDAAVPAENLELAPSNIDAVTLRAPETIASGTTAPDTTAPDTTEPDTTDPDTTDPQATNQTETPSPESNPQPQAQLQVEPPQVDPPQAEQWGEASVEASPQVEDSPAAASPDPLVEEPPAAPTRRTLTRDELANEAGCDQRMLHELERFNLIAGRAAGSAQVFDEDALEIARAAVAFGDFGLEPRHLRAFRLGAEREVGLVAQIIEPMTHRRSAGAQEEATKALQSMSSLAGTMRDAMARQLVKEYFPEQ